MRSAKYGVILGLVLSLLLMVAPETAYATNRWSPVVAARVDNLWSLFVFFGALYKIPPDEMAAICVQESTLVMDSESQNNHGPCQVNWYWHQKMLCKEGIACSSRTLKSWVGIWAGFRVYREMKRLWPWADPCTYQGSPKGCQYGKDVQEIRRLIRQRHP